MATDMKQIDLTPYSAKAVLDEYAVTVEETLLRAAVQTVYNFMSGEPRFNAQDRADNNRSAAEESISFLENRFPVLRSFEENFFKGQEYDRAAVTIATICGKIIDRDDDEYNPLFSRNLDLLDPSLTDRAAAIFTKAREYLENGLSSGEAPTTEALFVAQVEAFDILKSGLDDYQKGSVDLDYIASFQSDLLKVVPGLLTGSHGLNRALYDTTAAVYDLCRPELVKAQIIPLFPQGPAAPSHS